MAGRACRQRARKPRQVLSVVELQVEAFFEVRGKGFEGRARLAHIRVTDGADGRIGHHELIEVTACTRLVTRQLGLRRIVSLAAVTGGAGLRGMVRGLMGEGGVILIRPLRSLQRPGHGLKPYVEAEHHQISDQRRQQYGARNSPMLRTCYVRAGCDSMIVWS